MWDYCVLEKARLRHCKVLPNCSPEWFYQFTPPPVMYEFPLSHILGNIWCLQTLIFPLSWVWSSSHFGFNLHFFTIENLFICFLVIWISSSVNSLFRSFGFRKKKKKWPPVSMYRNTLCILSNSLFLDLYVASAFFWSMAVVYGVFYIKKFYMQCIHLFLDSMWLHILFKKYFLSLIWITSIIYYKSFKIFLHI